MFLHDRGRYQAVWRRPAGKCLILLGHSMRNSTPKRVVMVVV